MSKDKDGTTKIHSTAIVHPQAEIGEGVNIGPYAVIADKVRIGAHSSIGAHAVIEPGTQLGQNCRIYPHTVIGGVPQSLKFKGEDSLLKIGDYTIVREFATINRATADSGETVIGKHCYIMSYAHVAHDCRLGDHVIMANAATLAGHITIEDHAILGGLTPVHQFVRIGAYSMVGGASGVGKDILPYTMASGVPAKIYGLNLVGLKRHGFSSETIKKLEQAYKLIFHSKLNTSQAVAAIKEKISPCPEIEHWLEFIKTSQRGIYKKTSHDHGVAG